MCRSGTGETTIHERNLIRKRKSKPHVEKEKLERNENQDSNSGNFITATEGFATVNAIPSSGIFHFLPEIIWIFTEIFFPVMGILERLTQILGCTCLLQKTIPGIISFFPGIVFLFPVTEKAGSGGIFRRCLRQFPSFALRSPSIRASRWLTASSSGMFFSTHILPRYRLTRLGPAPTYP